MFFKQLKKQTRPFRKAFRNELDVALFTQVQKPIIEAAEVWVEYKITRTQQTIGSLIERLEAVTELFPEDRFIIKSALVGGHNFIGTLGPMITAYMTEYIKTADAILETAPDAADAVAVRKPKETADAVAGN